MSPLHNDLMSYTWSNVQNTSYGILISSFRAFACACQSIWAITWKDYGMDIILVHQDRIKRRKSQGKVDFSVE